MKTKLKTSMALLASAFLWVSCAGGGGTSPSAMDPVDYVNPYMGNISHLLVPTFPISTYYYIIYVYIYD